MSFDGNFEDEEDQLAPLRTSPGMFNRHSLSSHQVVTIGEETGQKETVIPYCMETTLRLLAHKANQMTANVRIADSRHKL